MTNILSTKATLATLSIGGWSARRLDKEESAKINKDKNAKADVGRLNKLLIDADAINAVTKIAGRARVAHYELTMPWLDDGARILPNAMFMKYAKAVREFEAEYATAADQFAKDYPQLVCKAKSDRMGGLFKDADYPHPSLIRSKFTFKKSIYPCPDAADFRVDLSKEIMDDLKADVEARMNDALENAMKEPVRRISDVVGSMVKRLKEFLPENEEYHASRLHKSIITNVTDLIAVLPDFNLTGDKALTKLISRMERELTQTTTDVLKTDEHVRKETIRSAEEILAAANKMMMA